MKNPNVLRYGGLVVLVIVVAFGVFFFSSGGKQETATQNQVAPAETEKMPSQTTKTFTHEDAGFQFDYPEDIVVEKKESTSSASYSSIELTSKSVSGVIKFEVEDTKAKSIKEWISQTMFPEVGALEIKETKLGSLIAREFVLSNRITIIAIDQGILFRLDVFPEKEKSYWEKVYNTFLSSFSFSAPQGAPAASVDTSSVSADDVVVEEDIVE